jgi:hypothetical protein
MPRYLLTYFVPAQDPIKSAEEVLQEIDDIIDDDDEEEDNDSEREGAGGLRGGGGAGCSALSGYLPPHSIRSSTFIGSKDRTYYLHTSPVHDTCRDESSPPCRRVSDTSRLRCGPPSAVW